MYIIHERRELKSRMMNELKNTANKFYHSWASYIPICIYITIYQEICHYGVNPNM